VLERRALRAMAAGHTAAGDAFLAAAIDEAGRAAERGATVPARELRGTLYYLAWVTGTPLSVDARAAAEADLAHAARSPHASPGTWATLSALHHAAGRHADAYAAAEQALRGDVFGSRTDNILMRLFVAAFDGGRDEAARAWCAEIARRAPGRWQAAQCALQSHAFRPGTTPREIAEVDADLSREPTDIAAAMAPRLELLRAAVYASNGFHKEARRILARSDAAAQPASELPRYAAMAYAQLGEPERARELLELFMRSGGATRATVVHGRWFAGLRAEAGVPLPDEPAR
jgi:tetratricopeptide (TPR) repeat protein